MKQQKQTIRTTAVTGFAFLLLSGVFIPKNAHAQDVWRTPFPGVRHLRRTTSTQHINVLEVDLCAAGISFRTTGSSERGRTVSSFGTLVGAQAAVNGDFFSSGYNTDGPAVHDGVGWGGADHTYVGPIAFGAGRVELVPHESTAGVQPWMREVVSGHPSLLVGGVPRDNQGDTGLCTFRAPRTAVGLSSNRRTLWVAVIDGRASSRVGMTCAELNDFMRSLGAHDATNLDGGGSSAMWIAGTGVVNFPSDGSQRVVGNHLALYARGSGPATHCPNQPPRGYLDSAACTGISGWAQDPDTPDAPIDVHLYFDGPAGAPGVPGFSVRAADRRPDLCTAIGSCDHGYTYPIPPALRDGRDHMVYAYGIDSSGGDNPQLGSSPATFRCAPATPTHPPENTVRRHIASVPILTAWRWTFLDINVLSDDVVARYREGVPLPASFSLVRSPDDPRVWLLDSGFKRHVPDPNVLAAWRWMFGDVQMRTSAELAPVPIGPAVLARPYLLRGTNPRVDLLDTPFPVPSTDAAVVNDASLDVPSPTTMDANNDRAIPPIDSSDERTVVPFDSGTFPDEMQLIVDGSRTDSTRTTGDGGVPPVVGGCACTSAKPTHAGGKQTMLWALLGLYLLRRSHNERRKSRGK